jgi:hypothetical protein
MLWRTRHRLLVWLAAVLLAVILVCAAGVLATPLRRLPQYGLAQARWSSQGIHHYRMTAEMTQGWIESGPWTVEIRDDRVVAGHDSATGAPLTAVQMRVAQRVLPIDRIFSALEKELRPPALDSIHGAATLLARLAPSLRDRLNHCAARMPLVDYDASLGYPSGVTVFASPCYPGGNWTVLVTAFSPLP